MEVMKIINRPGGGSYNLFITPGKKVEIHTHRENGELVNIKVFRLGDVAEYDSFTLSYSAVITGITAKNVIFAPRRRSTFQVGTNEPRTKRLKMENFACRNHRRK